MQWFVTHPGPTIALAAALIVVILIIVVPASIANIVDQFFQLCGRLVGALAGEAEAGAGALYAIVRGVFNLSATGSASAAKPKPAAAQPQASADATSSVEGPAPAAIPSDEDETPFLWVAETIFVRLLYLATVIVVVGSDFVFAILRLQAVLFPSLPTPVGNLAFLSQLTGAFFVSIVLLTGALTLDFSNVLPPPARLFPRLDDKKRRWLLVICVVSFILSLFVVGALFLQGQLLISEAATFPLGAIALAALIGVLEVLVAFLGAWGAIRGLAIILALLGGIVGLVLHLIALVLRWIADAFDVTGSSILPDVIYGIAGIFGRGREQPVRPSSAGNALTLAGYGERSASFTAALSDSLVRMYARSGLLAVGVYAEEAAVREDVRGRLARQGVTNISPIAPNDTKPLDTLRNHIVRAYRGKGPSNKMVLWVVDGDKTAESVETLRALKREMSDLNVIVLCLLNTAGARNGDPFAPLSQLAAPSASNRDDATIRATLVVDDRSPLYRADGEPDADQVVARSLAGMLLAPLHSAANPSFVTVLRNLNAAGYTFAALSTDPAAIVTSDATLARGGTSLGSVSADQAFSRTQETAGRLLTGANATTVAKKPEKTQDSLYLNYIVPISARTAEFSRFRNEVSNWLVQWYGKLDTSLAYLYGVVEGEGVDLSESGHTVKGDRYAQVSILYGLTDADLPRHAIGAPAGAPAGATQADGGAAS